MAQVFISYSKKDYICPDGSPLEGNVIDKIINAFNDSAISYWIDREGLDPGVTYADRISRNIKDCDTFLFISTANANASEWTLREISTAINFGKTILPVRIDRSDYADSVALYLSSVQYVDWLELGEGESLKRIVARIKNGAFFQEPVPAGIPKFTTIALYAGLVYLTSAYAWLSYVFLWVKKLRGNITRGGCAGWVCECGILISIYYIIRLLRRRKCSFIVPAGLVAAMALMALVMRDSDIMISAVLLLCGWLFLLCACMIRTKKRKSLISVLSREQVLMKWNDTENLLLVYLAVKLCILVISRYFNIILNSPFYL